RRIAERDEATQSRRPPKPAPPARPPKPLRKPRTPKPKPPAAAKPRPAPKPTPAARPKPGWEWGTPVHVGRPIAERIRLSPAWEKAGRLAAIGDEVERARDAWRDTNRRLGEVTAEATYAAHRGAAGADEKARLLAELKRLQALKAEQLAAKVAAE